jgi:hypothetical protein
MNILKENYHTNINNLLILKFRGKKAALLDLLSLSKMKEIIPLVIEKSYSPIDLKLHPTL